MASIEERIQKVVIEQLGVKAEDVKPGATFESLGADSLDDIELMIALEEEFDIEIPDDDWLLLSTVQQAVDHIRRVLPDSVDA